ncbi:hypothetical protein CERSUDRAFT_115123 [Gelatoporia subvermispora B]|uniref:Uncharacterized protein n=1 Tax=Ceriporiopsis subvermispora (strain B) TaxID=914234 RepID=M2RCL2_CERS8|nr:hypothetical protein CERSUDRAFT_115123 [Gelatoporia subvermispora B]
MLSFSALSVVATLAFSAFTSAAPLDPTSAVSTIENLLPVPVPALPIPALKRDSPRGIAAIVADVTVQVTPYVQQLKYVNKQNATLEVIEPVVVNIKGVFAEAVVEVQGLMGQSQDVILAPITGAVAITVTELAQIVAGLLTLVFEVLGTVLAVVDSSILDCVTYLLVSLAELVGCLVCAIIMLVDGILANVVATIVPLIGSIIPIIVQLNVLIVIKIFGIAL